MAAEFLAMSSPAEVAKVVQDQLSQYNYIFPRALHVSDNPGDDETLCCLTVHLRVV
jgi:hypothetical protein